MKILKIKIKMFFKTPIKKILNYQIIMILKNVRNGIKKIKTKIKYIIMDLQNEEKWNLEDILIQNKEIRTEDNKNSNNLSNNYNEYLPIEYNQDKKKTQKNSLENYSKTNNENILFNFMNTPELEEKLNKNKEDIFNDFNNSDSIENNQANNKDISTIDINQK